MILVPNLSIGNVRKMEIVSDKKKGFGVLLTNLLKAFDCLSHRLIIAKLNVEGLLISTRNLMRNYLTERKQRTNQQSL